ncbi:MAG TPA: family 20 glycosylhydrolase [Actinotalea sp.]
MRPAVPLVPAVLELELSGGAGFVPGADLRLAVVASADAAHSASGAAPGAWADDGAADLFATAGAAAALLAAAWGRAVPVVELDARPGAVVLELVGDREVLGLTPDVDDARASGAYRLEVTTGGARVTALRPAGLVHGTAALAQAGSGPASGDVVVPAMTVRDVPRFGWRGLSLDVARHFLDVTTVRAVIDLLASLRLNVLHLHLTDDQGWRLEIPSRPLLTELSGSTAVDGDPGGFYSVADFAGIVAYAAARGVTVVPEIDLPGHVNAALHAYGELTPSGDAPAAYTGIEVGFSRLHADLAATGPFLRAVLGDVIAQTPGPWVHLGGDEVLTMSRVEYSRLLQVAARHVRTAGKEVVGWQEVAHADLGPGTVIQYWTHEQSADDVAAAVRAGARLLLSPARRVYLDMKYDETTPLGLEWAGHIELRDAYDWEPLDVVPGVPESAVVGVEAALWSETVHGLDDATFLLLPRLAAVAEVAWSAPERRDWDDFTGRCSAHAARWEQAGLRWYRSPQVEWDPS